MAHATINVTVDGAAYPSAYELKQGVVTVRAAIGSKIAAAIRSAIRRDLPLDIGQVVGITFESARYICDLDTAHGVVVIEATVEET